MFVRSLRLGLLSGLLLTCGAGCGAKPTAQQASASNGLQQGVGTIASDTVAAVHWIGTKRLLADTNAGYLKGILELPQSTALKNQTLDKLALWLAHATPTNYAAPPTNYAAVVAASPAARLLRPLLSDVLEQEGYLEIDKPDAGSPEFALAMRLDGARAGVWQSNIASALQDVPGPKPHVSVTRAGAWTLLDITQASATVGSRSTVKLASRIETQRSGNPFFEAFFGTEHKPDSPANDWLEAHVDLERARAWPVLSAICASSCSNLPSVNLHVAGDGIDVRTRAELEFAQPLAIEIDPWNIPTNIIHDPLISFGAIRSLRPFLTNWPGWNSMHLATTPNQAFVWAVKGPPMQEFAAFPWPEASSVLPRFSAKVAEICNALLANSGFGTLEIVRSNVLSWHGAPFMSPELRAIRQPSGEFALAGLVAVPDSPLPVPSGLLLQLQSRTNLISYAWEITDPAVEQWLYLSQLARLITHKAQLPPASIALQWLGAARQKLGNCVSTLGVESPARLYFTRRSSLGLTAAELHLLADWLESPDFPRTLRSLVVPAPKTPSRVRN